MKQFLRSTLLRTHLPLAALAAGFALWASPARAFTVNGGNTTVTLGAGETVYVNFSCTADEVGNADGISNGAQVNVSANPNGIVNLFSVMADGTLSSRTTINMWETAGTVRYAVRSGQVAVRGASPGQTTVTFDIGDGNPVDITVTVTEPTNITFRDRNGEAGTMFYVAESDNNPYRLTLDFGYQLTRDVSFDVTCSADADHVTFHTPLNVYSPSTTAAFDGTIRSSALRGRQSP